MFIIFYKNLVEIGDNMELVRSGEKEIRFILDTAFLSQYGLTVDIFEKLKPFSSEIVDDLLDLSNKKYNLNFDETNVPKEIFVIANHVVMVFENKI